MFSKIQVKEYAMQIYEVVKKCLYCGRENKRSAQSYAENPYCNSCLNERIEKAVTELGPGVSTGSGRYVSFTPLTQIKTSNP